MNDSLPNLEICGELGDWEITLLNGEVLTIAAHGYSEIEQSFEFSILIDGNPRYMLPIIRIPKQIVDKILGG
jgi:hypothetical protein